MLSEPSNSQVSLYVEILGKEGPQDATRTRNKPIGQPSRLPIATVQLLDHSKLLGLTIALWQKLQERLWHPTEQKAVLTNQAPRLPRAGSTAHWICGGMKHQLWNDNRPKRRTLLGQTERQHWRQHQKHLKHKLHLQWTTTVAVETFVQQSRERQAEEPEDQTTDKHRGLQRGSLVRCSQGNSSPSVAQHIGHHRDQSQCRCHQPHQWRTNAGDKESQVVERLDHYGVQLSELKLARVWWSGTRRPWQVHMVHPPSRKQRMCWKPRKDGMQRSCVFSAAHWNSRNPVPRSLHRHILRYLVHRAARTKSRTIRGGLRTRSHLLRRCGTCQINTSRTKKRATWWSRSWGSRAIPFLVPRLCVAGRGRSDALKTSRILPSNVTTIALRTGTSDTEKISWWTRIWTSSILVTRSSQREGPQTRRLEGTGLDLRGHQLCGARNSQGTNPRTGGHSKLKRPLTEVFA